MIAGPQIEILMVDDREDGLLALEAVLKDGDHRLIKATSGRQALSLLARHQFAMILLDVQMPDLDGFETAKLIRQHAGCEHVPIIFVTAINKDDSYVNQGYDAGAVDYIFKPFDPHVLRAKVAVFAELHRKNLQIREQVDLIASIKERERIHERTRMEVESLRRYQNLANAIPLLLWKTGPTGEIVYSNQGWKDYTGFDVDMNSDTKWQNAFEPEDLQNFLKIWLERMSSQSNFDLECRIIKSDGTRRWHWLKVVVERNDVGEVVGWIGTCTDIHDRKLLEEKAIEALEMAESASKEKTYFLANMSHEIRTPLGAILGFSELLLDSRRSQNEKINFVTIIRNNGKQLLKIIDEVLDISKIEAGRLDLESLEIDTVQFFQDLFISLNLKAVEKGLKLRFQPVGSIPRSITTDPARFRQILINVISNAIKFTENGGVTVSVGWQTEGSQAWLKLYVEVTDTGVGIEKKYADKLFNPFVQGDSSTTRRFGGTGLGLALSRKLARALGGDVYLERSSKEGSTFKIEIMPDAYGSEEEVSSFFEAPIEEFNPENSDVQVLAGISILLAEDVLENQLLITKFLQTAGAKVEVVANGLEAVTVATGGNHDVILMDLQMPVLDGYQATARLRKNGFQKPIIAVTAHALSEERQKCLQVGFNEHLTKPVDRSALIARVLEFSNKKPQTEGPTLTAG